VFLINLCFKKLPDVKEKELHCQNIWCGFRSVGFRMIWIYLGDAVRALQQNYPIPLAQGNLGRFLRTGHPNAQYALRCASYFSAQIRPLVRGDRTRFELAPADNGGGDSLRTGAEDPPCLPTPPVPYESVVCFFRIKQKARIAPPPKFNAGHLSARGPRCYGESGKCWFSFGWTSLDPQAA